MIRLLPRIKVVDKNQHINDSLSFLSSDWEYKETIEGKDDYGTLDDLINKATMNSSNNDHSWSKKIYVKPKTENELA